MGTYLATVTSENGTERQRRFESREDAILWARAAAALCRGEYLVIQERRANWYVVVERSESGLVGLRL